MRIDFVIGGTQKGGTSALDSFLRLHPEICMPIRRKELHFFDTRNDRLDYARYHAHFDPQPKHQVIGEKTPTYMYWESAPRRVRRYNPAMKWILVLRDPTERAFSAWNMETNRGRETLPFREAIEQEPERCRTKLPFQHRIFSYVDRGLYAHQVRRLFDIFGEENVLVLLTEDLRNEHSRTMRRVFEFLGVDASVEPPETSVSEGQYAGTIDSSLRSHLVETFYFDIRELERLLKRDLSSWYAGHDLSPAIDSRSS